MEGYTYIMITEAPRNLVLDVHQATAGKGSYSVLSRVFLFVLLLHIEASKPPNLSM